MTTPVSFNPRARMGRDGPDRQAPRLAAVSIHAPAWGATIIECATYTPTWFQSTRPHGARLYTGITCQEIVKCFNPRARMGRDVLPPMRLG